MSKLKELVEKRKAEIAEEGKNARARIDAENEQFKQKAIDKLREVLGELYDELKIEESRIEYTYGEKVVIINLMNDDYGLITVICNHYFWFLFGGKRFSNVYDFINLIAEKTEEG